MKKDYKNIKTYQSSWLALELARVNLRNQGIYLNKTQTLDLAIRQLCKAVKKLNS